MIRHVHGWNFDLVQYTDLTGNLVPSCVNCCGISIVHGMELEQRHVVNEE